MRLYFNHIHVANDVGIHNHCIFNTHIASLSGCIDRINAEIIATMIKTYYGIVFLVKIHLANVESESMLSGSNSSSSDRPVLFTKGRILSNVDLIRDGIVALIIVNI